MFPFQNFTTSYFLKAEQWITFNLKRPTFLFFIFAVSYSATDTIAQPGSLDNSFGNNGIVISDFEYFGESVNAIAIQNDQKSYSVDSRKISLPLLILLYLDTIPMEL